MSRLRRAKCSSPGITRRRRGRGFEYVDEDGGRVEDPEVLRRIRELVIPPAWADVWICPYPNGRWVDVRSADINTYIKEITGADFSAKDFRTWNATVIAAVGLAVSGLATGTQGPIEEAVLDLLEEEDSAAIENVA